MSTRARTRMVRLTPRRRHLAAIITIAVSTAFVTVMVLAGNLITQVIGAGSQSTYRGVDLVATPLDPTSGTPVTIEGAEDVWPAATTYAYFENAAGTRTFAEITQDPPHRAVALSAGRAASGPDEVVLGGSTAEALDVKVGDSVTVPDIDTPEGSSGPVSLKVSGIAQVSTDDALSFGFDQVHVNPADAAVFFGDDPGAYASEWFGTVPEGTDPAEVARAASTDAVPVVTGQEAADAATRQSLGGFAVLGLVLLVFVAIALLTTAVVISNTFTVTLAQRTRSLALLRTLGATRRQVAAVVLRESLGVGLIGALIGALAGHVIIQAALLVAQGAGWIGGFVPVPVSILSILVPVVVGLLVTLAAGILPVRRATAVAPLEALRPAVPTQQARFGVRGMLCLIAVLVGAAALAGGVVASQAGQPAVGILLALGGGTVSFLGILVGLVSVTRPLARGVGALVSRLGGLPARIAASNTTRHPGRSAATIGALLIGTTLMTMMAVGARTAESTLTEQLDSRRPIDVVVTGAGLTDAVATDIAAVRGVGAAQAVPTTDVDVHASQPMTVYGIDPAHLADVVNRTDLAPVIRDGTLVTGEQRAKDFGLTDGQHLSVPGTDGGTVELTVVVNGDLNMSITTPGTLARIAPAGGAETGSGTAVLAKLEPRGTGDRGDQDAMTVVDGIRTQLTAQGLQESEASYGVVEKEAFGQVLDVLLGITLALLGVAVVVALVGVANTLSLGVVERTGENALLRALGTTRGQMRAMLGWEGVLLAVIGAVLGIVLGVVYGVLGVMSILGGNFPVTVTIPWVEIAAVLVLAIAAGWGASVLPGRAAARTSPAQALASAE
ncbi:FtsX-like permease family protein [Brachybacterium sp. AOP25-B2-12]|uniref:FtsX-like permease family protein n=1 Tax=Brachybacterium sp. AOP25-B2-12 TaxID=3457710 RepID=UPI0040345E43